MREEILRWGIKPPGGTGGGRGMPSSLITAALLPDQGEVEAILEQSLADDADASGRDRLTEALEALAEDPRFKQIVDVVQAKVDEAFTPTGRKRGGPGVALAGTWPMIGGGLTSGSGRFGGSPRRRRGFGGASKS